MRHKHMWNVLPIYICVCECVCVCLTLSVLAHWWRRRSVWCWVNNTNKLWRNYWKPSLVSCPYQLIFQTITASPALTSKARSLLAFWRLSSFSPVNLTSLECVSLQLEPGLIFHPHITQFPWMRPAGSYSNNTLNESFVLCQLVTSYTLTLWSAYLL
jgi:uncharacterized iron-regulated membrane protein